MIFLFYRGAALHTIVHLCLPSMFAFRFRSEQTPEKRVLQKVT